MGIGDVCAKITLVWKVTLLTLPLWDMVSDLLPIYQYLIMGDFIWATVATSIIVLSFRFFVVFNIYQPTPTLPNIAVMYFPGDVKSEVCAVLPHV